MEAIERRLQELEATQSEEFRLILGAFEQQKRALQRYAETWTDIYGTVRELVRANHDETREEIGRIQERLARLEDPPAA